MKVGQGHSKRIFVIPVMQLLFMLLMPSFSAALISDDFNSSTLNTTVWTAVDPRGDATFAMTGTETPDALLSITVPAGMSHDVWSGNMAPRIMQTAGNTDFEVEVRFQSILDSGYQIQGIIVEQDANNYMRFDFVQDTAGTRVFAASFTDGTPTVRSNVMITVGNPLYLKVRRVGDQWTQLYSFDGSSWTTAGVFNHTLTVTSVGPFAGNAGTPAPAFTCLIDYFFNTSSPIIPEDVEDLTPPVIDVWYGKDQLFGQIGIPQVWVNILGKVTDSSGIASLTYSLNSGTQLPFSIGPDGKRLQSPGDFNIDIAYDDLLCGQNTVDITAVDVKGNSSYETVNVEYACNNIWPLPYSIDWSSVSKIEDAAQIVDGRWTLEANSIRPAVVGYDRNVAIGDIDTSWKDYEITVPITIKSPLDSSVPWGPLFGLIARWQGHYDWDGTQPRSGWWPLGVLAVYDWVPQASDYRLRILGNNEKLIAEDMSGFHLNVGVTYIFKLRVETIGQNTVYYLKVWQNGSSEPSGWNISGQGLAAELKYGSILLLTHYADVSFGNVTITPGPFSGDMTPPVISNIAAAADAFSARISWRTNELSTSMVSYGTGAAYEMGAVQDNGMATSHEIILTGLIPGTAYHCRISSTDAYGNSSDSGDVTFVAAGNLSDIRSDDFSAQSLNTGLWSVVNPLNDAVFGMTGTGTPDALLSITVPAAASHDVWSGNMAPRIMQAANNRDFEVEVKFQSQLTGVYQIQGIIVEQDNNNFLRFDFVNDSSGLRAFAASFTNGTPTARSEVPLIAGNPLYLRVKRAGNLWTQSYSYDGLTWSVAGSFSHTLTVNTIGPFAGNAGNAGNPVPAFTSFIDYFYNTASPVMPEDTSPPVVTVQPASQSVDFAKSAAFSVEAVGTMPLSYQWLKDGLSIPGATGPSYNTPAVTTADNGSAFRCVVANEFGTVASKDAILTVNGTTPKIIVQPADQSVAEGRKATFGVVAAGTGTLYYQWRRNGEDIPDATKPSYTTQASVLADDGSIFRCAVTNALGKTTTDTAKLTVARGIILNPGPAPGLFRLMAQAPSQVILQIPGAPMPRISPLRRRVHKSSFYRAVCRSKPAVGIS